MNRADRAPLRGPPTSSAIASIRGRIAEHLEKRCGNPSLLLRYRLPSSTAFARSAMTRQMQCLGPLAPSSQNFGTTPSRRCCELMLRRNRTILTHQRDDAFGPSSGPLYALPPNSRLQTKAIRSCQCRCGCLMMQEGQSSPGWKTGASARLPIWLCSVSDSRYAEGFKPQSAKRVSGPRADAL